MSAPAVAERVRRLEEQGIIKGFAALIEPESVGCDLLAFIAVTMSDQSQRERLLERIMTLDTFQECHHVAGDYDYLLKVRCAGTHALEEIVSVSLKGIPGVKTQTTVVLSTSKETSNVPLPGSPRG
jgi:Lrp/AsnC family leucine-responsive transcriptional regulator